MWILFLMKLAKIQKIIILILGVVALSSGIYHLVLMKDASYSGGIGKDFSILYSIFPTQYNGLLNLIAGLILLSTFWLVDFDKEE